MVCPLSPHGALDRARLVEDNLDLVRRVAHAIHIRCRQYIDLDELIAVGNVGLVEAAARFDASRGVPFRAYAHYRVQGAILDGLRRATVLPRGDWRRFDALRSAAAHLEQRHLDAARAGGAVPEIERDQAVSELRNALGTVRKILLRSLHETGEGELPVTDEDPADRIDRARAAARLNDAVASLPERQQTIVRQHYWDQQNLLEVGRDLGVSKPTASRLHERAVHNLRLWYHLERRAWRRKPRRQPQSAASR